MIRAWAPVILATLPHQVAAFADMDCVTTDICQNQVCDQTPLPMLITFDWGAGTSTTTFRDQSYTLPAAGQPSGGTLTFSDFARGLGADLLIQAQNGQVQATLAIHAIRGASPTLVTANCGAQETA